MRNLSVIFLTVGLMGCFAVEYAHADSVGLGLSYNLVALSGNINYSGPDIEGGIAAAGDINYTQSGVLSVGSKLGSNPSLPYAMVAGGTITGASGSHYVVNGGGSVSGNVISKNATSGSLFWGSSQHLANNGGALSQGDYWTTSGLSSLDGIAKTMSAAYASMSTAGTSSSTTASRLNLDVTPISGQKAYVFNISAAEFSSASQALWINSVPAGATVVINVSGCSSFVSGGQSGCVMNLTPFLNGNQLVSTDYSHIVFNFTDTAEQNLIVNQQLDGLILAPTATLEGYGDVGGTIWVGSDASSGEIHLEGFTGYTPPPPSPSVVTPEPGTMGLLGTGILSLAGLLRRRRRS